MPHKQTQKNIICALVIRLRLYLSNEYDNCFTEESRYDFASQVLNISPDRARHILMENKDIRCLTKQECISQLQRLSYPMYIVAVSDITHHKYLRLLQQNQ